MTELVANSPTPGTGAAIGTLTTALAPSDLSMVINAPAFPGLRSAGADQFRVIIDSEIIVVQTSSTGASPWTILVRGAENSTAATHQPGATVNHYLTAGALDGRYLQELGPTGMVLNTISGVGNLTGTYALDLSSADLTIAGAATLTGDTVMTVTGFSAGSQGQFNVVETGGHALSVVANGQTLPLTIPPSGACVVEMIAMDGNLFVDVVASNVMLGAQPLIWTGTIAPLVNGQLDTTVWTYQSIAAGHLTVLTDPLGTQGTVLTMDITETG